MGGGTSWGRPNNRGSAAVRRAIQHSQESLNHLSARYGINPKTVAKWRKRASTQDAPMGDEQARLPCPDL